MDPYIPDASTGDIRVERSAVGATLITGDSNAITNHITIVYASEALRDRSPVPGGSLGQYSPNTRSGEMPNPYRALNAFDETCSAFFFGREELTSKLLDRLADLAAPASAARVRLLAVMGPSGSGKSSIARAGLLPELARTKATWLGGTKVIVLNPGAHPVSALAAAMARLVTKDPAPLAKQQEFVEQINISAASGSHDALARFGAMQMGSGDGPLIVLVDQFEEAYTLCRSSESQDEAQALQSNAERNVFLNALFVAASEPGGRVCVVLTLRSDFFSAITEHPALSKAVAASNEMVPAMDRDDLRRAIAEPARAAGHALDESTVERVLDEAEGRGATVLPLVQFALTQLWDGLRDGKTPTETLNKIGGVGGAVAGRADKVMSSLRSDRERALAERAFLGAVQLGEGVRDTRRRTWLDQVVPVGMHNEEAQAILKTFVDERLLAMGSDEKQKDRVWIELPHEALIRNWKTLERWIETQRDDLRLRKRLQEAAEAWAELGWATGRLWRPPDLDLLRRYAARTSSGLTALQTDFLAASERHLRSGHWRSRIVLAVIVALASISATLFVIKDLRDYDLAVCRWESFRPRS